MLRTTSARWCSTSYLHCQFSPLSSTSLRHWLYPLLPQHQVCIVAASCLRQLKGALQDFLASGLGCTLIAASIVVPPPSCLLILTERPWMDLILNIGIRTVLEALGKIEADHDRKLRESRSQERFRCCAGSGFEQRALASFVLPRLEVGDISHHGEGSGL